MCVGVCEYVCVCVGVCMYVCMCVCVCVWYVSVSVVYIRGYYIVMEYL